MKTLPLLIFVVIAFFVIGVVAPRVSRCLQRRYERRSRALEHKADRNGGSLGDASRWSLEKSRRATRKSAEVGRRVHEKVTPED